MKKLDGPVQYVVVLSVFIEVVVQIAEKIGISHFTGLLPHFVTKPNGKNLMLLTNQETKRQNMDVVTGSFGYIGKYITKELLDRGREVKTITTHPDKPNPFGSKVKASSYDFDNPDKLTRYLEGCETLYNTYWIRFNYRQWSFEKAIENTKVLFNCAKKAGVKKIIHISVTNVSLNDKLPYYHGKALQEEALKNLGIEYTIVRPTLVFGIEDILVNNIAWTIRKFPVVPILDQESIKCSPYLLRI